MKNPHPGTGRHWRVPVGLIMLTSSVLLWPGTGMASPSCEIYPENPTVDSGGSLVFYAKTDDMRRWGKKYDWTFEEGSPGSSSWWWPWVSFDKAGGPWKVVLKVSDRRNEAECTTMVTVSGEEVEENASPSANANGPYSGTAGSAVSFSSAGSNDSDGSIVSRSWDFGDGSKSSQANPSHAYAVAGNYSVTLTVTDDDGASDSDTAAANIVAAPVPNVAPTANAGRDQTVTIAAGQTSIAVTLNGSGSSDSDGSIASYTWTGSPDPADVVSPTVNLSAGSHTFNLVVTDDDGANQRGGLGDHHRQPRTAREQGADGQRRTGPNGDHRRRPDQHRRDPERQRFQRLRRQHRQLHLDRLARIRRTWSAPPSTFRRAATPSIWSSPTTTAPTARRTR